MVTKLNYRKIGLYFLILLLVGGCAGLRTKRRGLAKELYHRDFLVRVEEVKKLYERGEAKKALALLDDPEWRAKLSGAELALHSTLKGVVYFSQNQYNKALQAFHRAEWQAEEDPSLKSQVLLNLAQTYRQIDNWEKSIPYWEEVDPDYLESVELKKYYFLSYEINLRGKKEKKALRSFILYFKDVEGREALYRDSLFAQLIQLWDKFSLTQRWSVLLGLKSTSYPVLAVLGEELARTAYLQGDGELGEKVADFLREEFEEDHHLRHRLQVLKDRAKQLAALDSKAIGVILPLSGAQEKFGKRVFAGSDLALKTVKKNYPGSIMPTLHFWDGQGKEGMGALGVRELVKRHSVSVIVGGLFPAQALAQYQQARELGVFFISLAQVNLPRQEKDHLLLEVSGSVESQVASALSSKTLENLGRRFSVLYSDDLRGRAYIEEIWRQAASRGAEIKGVMAYSAQGHDFRDPVAKLLGIKFERERREEGEILEEIHTLKGKRAVRRIQLLTPIVDFDWIFIPGLPDEVVKIIPTFRYYDAKGLKFMGGPSWRSRIVSQELSGNSLNFVGDYLGREEKEVLGQFKELMGRRASLSDLLAFEGVYLALDMLLSREGITHRGEFHQSLANKGFIKGRSSLWKLQEGLWLKEMGLLTLKQRKAVMAF